MTKKAFHSSRPEGFSATPDVLELEQARQPSEERRTECKPCPSVGSSRATHDEQERERDVCKNVLHCCLRCYEALDGGPCRSSRTEREKREALILPNVCVCVCCTQYIVVLHLAAFSISSKLNMGNTKLLLLLPCQSSLIELAV